MTHNVNFDSRSKLLTIQDVGLAAATENPTLESPLNGNKMQNNKDEHHGSQPTLHQLLRHGSQNSNLNVFGAAHLT